MNNQINIADLPPLLVRFVDLIGLGATMKIVEKRGGTRLYIPEQYNRDGYLIRLIGEKKTQILIDAMPLETVAIPLADKALKEIRNQDILSRFDAGESAAKLARQYGTTERNVFRITANHRREDEAHQESLF